MVDRWETVNYIAARKCYLHIFLSAQFLNVTYVRWIVRYVACLKDAGVVGSR